MATDFGLRAAVLLLAATLGVPSPAGARDLYKKPYVFTSDVFTVHEPIWTQHLAPLRGKPRLNYLEVGPYEGRSFFWLIDNVLTHPTSRATAIDVFFKGTSTYAEAYESTFRKNLALSGAEKRVTVIKGRSQVELRALPLDSFDLIYIDGSHDTPDVLVDLALSWGLLKEGGLMILDDYIWRPEWAPDLSPRLAINTFLSIFSREIRLVHRGVQVILEKQPDPCDKLHYEGCSVLGSYLYDWRDGRLLRAADLHEVELSFEEDQIIRQILLRLRLGQVQRRVPESLEGNATFQRLNEKLALGF